MSDVRYGPPTRDEWDDFRIRIVQNALKPDELTVLKHDLEHNAIWFRWNTYGIVVYAV